jgi:thioredoxin-like negative regulator of GroEL
MDEAWNDCGEVEALGDREFEPLLAASSRPVVAVLSTDWSPACRLLRPVIARLAMEFAGSVTVVALDAEEALSFRQRYGVDAVPQILAFERRRLIGRLSMPDDAALLRNWFAATLRLAVETSVASAGFDAAWARARRVHDELLSPAKRAVAPHLDAVGRHMEAFERQLAAERNAGGLSDEDEMLRRSDETERVFAPFRGEMDALAAAEAAALAAYEDLMQEALDEFAACHRRCRISEPAT